MATTPMSKWRALFMTMGVAACSFAAAQAGSWSARVSGPTALGDQVYAGGVLEVREVGGGQLLAVSIDGRRIALLFKDPDSRPGDGRASVLAFRRDPTGLVHLVGLRDAEGADKPDRPTTLRLATQRRGVTTVSEFTAVAQRHSQPSTPLDPVEAVVRLTK